MKEKKLCLEAKIWFDRLNGLYAEVIKPSTKTSPAERKHMTVDEFSTVLTGSTRKVEEKEVSTLITSIPPFLFALKPSIQVAQNKLVRMTGYFAIPGRKRVFSYSCKGVTFNEEIPWPNLFFKATSLNGKSSSISVWAYTDSVLTENTVLYKYPFGNVSSNGSVCMGGYSRSVENTFELFDYVDAFYTLTTNEDLFSSHYNQSGKTQYQFLNDLKELEKFPAKMLVPHEGKKVKDVLK